MTAAAAAKQRGRRTYKARDPADVAGLVKRELQRRFVDIAINRTPAYTGTRRQIVTGELRQGALKSMRGDGKMHRVR